MLSCMIIIGKILNFFGKKQKKQKKKTEKQKKPKNN